MKKILSVLLLCCILAGCQTPSSSSGTSSESQSSASVQSSQPPETTPSSSSESQPGSSSAPATEASSEPASQPETSASAASQPPEESGSAPTTESSSKTSSQPESSTPYIDPVEMPEAALEEEMSSLENDPPPVSTLLLPQASGSKRKSDSGAEIDYSNTKEGYVMARYSQTGGPRLKVQVIGPATTYSYDLPAGSAWSTFPLSDGNGSYTVRVLQNAQGSKYAILTSVSISVALEDEFAPFLRPNQYVNYGTAPNTVAKAAELTAGLTDPLEMVQAVYNYVVSGMTYDTYKAQTVKSGYLPVLDTVLAQKTGICFDYAALMTGMLRSQGIPCKLVVGYAGTQYHAWVSVWTEEAGWIDGVIFFNGTTWQRMDPTFASSGASNEYIGDGSNYTTKYLY